MATSLVEGQFMINDYLTWGGPTDEITIPPNGFTPGQADWRTNEVPAPTTDLTFMGTEFLTGGTWVWDLVSNKDNEVGAASAFDKMAQMWLRQDNRTGNTLDWISYRLGGRTRRVYGRPRRWLQSVVPTFWTGVTPAVCDFKLADPRTYDDTETVLNMSGPGTITIDGGMAPTPVRLEWTSPSNASFSGGGWTIAMTGSFAGTMTADTRWQTFEGSDKHSHVDMLTPSSSLTGMLQPGSNTYTYSGSGALKIRFRKAYWGL